jgi:hypothetical protein
VTVVNDGSVPVIENVWIYVSRQETERALQSALERMDEKMRNALNMSDADVMKIIPKDLKKKMRVEVMAVFDKGAIVGEKEVTLYVDRLRAEINAKWDVFARELTAQQERVITRDVRKQVESFRERIRAANFDSLAAFQQEWKAKCTEILNECDGFLKGLKLATLQELSEDVYTCAFDYFHHKNAKSHQRETALLESTIRLLEDQVSLLKGRVVEKPNVLEIAVQTDAYAQPATAPSGEATPSSAAAKDDIAGNGQFGRSRLMQPAAYASHGRPDDESAEASEHTTAANAAAALSSLKICEGKIRELELELEAYQEKNKEFQAWQHEKVYLENEISFLKGQLEENNRLHDALLNAVQRMLVLFTVGLDFCSLFRREKQCGDRISEGIEGDEQELIVGVRATGGEMQGTRSGE